MDHNHIIKEIPYKQKYISDKKYYFNYRAFTNLQNNNTIKADNKLLDERVREIEGYIAHEQYINKDKLPHDGKYYDRSKY